MPITVTTPVQGDFVGPGTIIRAETFSVLPAGHHWDALLFQPGTQDELSVALTLREGQNTEMWLNVTEPTLGARTPVWLPQLAQPVGAEFELHVRVINAQSTQIVDTSGPIGVVWRPDPAGVAWVQSLSSSSPIQGGFTETDRLVLESTNASVISALPLTIPAGGVAQLGLDQVLKGPPVDFLSEGENLLLTGRGSITRTVGPNGVYAYGGRWSIESAPAGLGKLDGQAVLYEQRISQFVVVKNRLGGGLYAFSIDDSHYDSGEITWPIPFPVRIDFDILPGVTVRWRWLLLLQ